jgi:hypothetical protein
MRRNLLMLAAAGSLGASGAGMALPPARPAPHPAAAAGAACHIALPAAQDAESFTNAGRSGGAASAQQTGAVFATAINHLCATGIVRPANVARYRSLLVRDAEGASDPNVYDDAEEHPGALIIEFAFADAGPPSQAQVEAALRCWRNPHGAGCAHEDVGP